MKKLLPYALCLLVGGIAGAIIVQKSCGPGEPDPAYWVDRAEYEARIRKADALHQDDQAALSQAKGTIAEQTIEIQELLADAMTPSPAEVKKDREIAALEEKVAAFEAQGDLASALAASKAENTAWAEKFSLAAGKHLDSLSALNKAWQVKFDAQVEISLTWQAAYEREHALRLTCDDLRARLESVGPASSFERVASDVEEIGVGAYSAIKHKDPIPLAAWAVKKLGVKAWRMLHGGNR